jgi:hypothetical protein
MLTFSGLFARRHSKCSACGPAKWLTDRPLAAPKRSFAADVCSAEVGQKLPLLFAE